MQDLTQEELRAVRLRVVEELVRFVLLDDLADVHEEDPVGHPAREAE